MLRSTQLYPVALACCSALSATLYKVCKSIPSLGYWALLTARGRAAEPSLFAELGVRGVINKPFNPPKLADQVAKVLGKSA